jgi:O-antigen/teichoic acid export membrane protein
MRILSVSVFINFMLYAADATLTAGNQNYAKIYIQIIGTVVGAAGGYFFIQYFGAKGAAFTDILIRAVQMVLFFALVYKLRYMSFKPIIRLAVPFILILLISLVLVKIMPHAYIMRPIFALVIVTPVLIYLIGLKKIRSLISR